MKLPRVALFGAGAWGINHLRVLSGESHCQLAAVVDPDPTARRRASAMAPSARLLASTGDALGNRSIDAVVIASPAPTHADLACAALDAGKHVLIEKPLALSLSDAKRVAAKAERIGRVAMLGHLMVFHPAVVRMRELLATGDLGSVHYVHSTRANLGRVRSDESVLWSFGPHELSILHNLFEQSPRSVSARGQCIVHPSVEDVVFMSLRYANGEMAHVHLSRLHPRKERRLSIVCSKKLVEFDDVAPEKLRIYDRGYERLPDFTQYAEYLAIRDGDVYIPKLDLEEPLRVQLRHFLDCIRTGATPRTDLDSAVRVTEVLAAAQESLSCDGAPIALTASTV